MERESTPEDLPILPLRNTVLFPGVVLPINVGRDQSLKLLKEANKGGHDIGVMTQRDSEVENPASADLHDVGTVARIVKMLRMPDGSNTDHPGQAPLPDGRSRERGAVPEGQGYALPGRPGRLVGHRKGGASAEPPGNEHGGDRLAPTSSEAAIAIKNIDSLRFLVHFIAANMNAEKEQNKGSLRWKASRNVSKS